MDDQHQLTVNKDLPEVETIVVPKEALAALIRQNKQGKDDNAELLTMLGASVEILTFVKNTILGGTIPKDMNLGGIIKLATKIPRILNRLDEDTITLLADNMKIIMDCAGKHLSEDQINKIST